MLDGGGGNDTLTGGAGPTTILAGNGNVCSTGGHNDIQVAPGVYRREFGTCYDKGVRFGACAAIVSGFCLSCGADGSQPIRSARTL